jgi:4-amino-4-deoxy-L-arabinose transferase-like glycosyltransferase
VSTLTAKTDTLSRKSWLDTPLLSTFSLNWEIALYILLVVIALVTRFYDVGARVMSHDESLHTLFSWNLYVGKGYQHDPMMHGPSLFHITALMYFLFGDSDFTARLGPVLFGVAMVILPYWFRPWLGRIGALAASFMILISPGLLYYSRYIRHDTFLDFFTLLMFLAFFQYMRTRANRWLFIGAAGVSLMICTMEAAYIHGFIGVTFIVWAFMWENLSEAKPGYLGHGWLCPVAVGGGNYFDQPGQRPHPDRSKGKNLRHLAGHSSDYYGYGVGYGRVAGASWH